MKKTSNIESGWQAISANVRAERMGFAIAIDPDLSYISVSKDGLVLVKHASWNALAKWLDEMASMNPELVTNAGSEKTPGA